jgi:uncharacterized protein (TIGR02246 family)
MMNITRILAPMVALGIAACGDGPSSVAATARPSSQPEASIGGTSADQGIDAVVAALNAAWVAKSAAGYAAPYAEDAESIAPTGAILAGRAAIEARHVILFNGPLATTSQIVTIRRVQFLTGTIAIVDGNSVLTGFTVLPPGLPATEPGVARTLVRYVMIKRGGQWEIAAAQSTAIPPSP